MLSFRRTFTVNPEGLAPGHPYSVRNSGRSSQITFLEFRGTGAPSSNFGHAGDVYVDLTPGAQALYWRDRHGQGPGQWRRWTALLLDKVPLYKYLMTHPWANDPQTSDLYLWVDPGGVTWTSRAEICASRVMMIQKGIATITPGERHPDVERLVAEILVKMMQEEDRRTLPPIQDKRPRYASPSPPHAGPSRPVEPNRGRSHSSATQYSSPEAFRSPRGQLPAQIHSPSAYHSSALSPLPPLRSPASPIAYTSPPSYHSRPPPPTSPTQSTVDPRGPLRSAEPFGRRTPGVYPDFSVVSPRAPEASPSPPLNTPPGPLQPGATEQERRETFAWSEMQRAQYAEAHFKRELRLKNRELSKFKKKEKDVISMSFLYQKKEQELRAGSS
ncbi:hypothetical protein B0H16DRAFT_790350 [Mycena metata]|uniref:Uncharacterized protein n=1 Tax=Mycena metata TaxID=1033252 RepID=A0AAD7GK65_9AGAR|nr:hypothetical protein B0H16DRAFT_790350 [Mycena metata]